MLERSPINEQYVYYYYKNKYILINASNGRWYVFDKVNDLNNCINSLLNNEIDTFWIEKLNLLDFFQKISEYTNPTLHLHLTNKCNLRCPHCYMRAKDGLDNELSSEEFIKLISDFSDNGGERIVFSGGEISLVNDYLSVLKHSKKLGLYNLVITNGTLWTDDEISEAAAYIDCVQISIDGYDEISNAKIRGKGSFEKSLKCIDSFLNSGVETLLTVTPLYGFENEIAQYIAFGNKMLAKYNNKNFYIVFNDNLSKGRVIEPTPSKNEKYYQATLQILDGIYPDYSINEFWNTHREANQNCGYGKVAVDSDGSFAFCTSVKDVCTVGNVRTMPMQEIIRMANSVAKKTSVNNLIPCRDCDFKYICGGGCRIDHFENADRIIHESDVGTLKRFNPCNESVFENFLDLMILSFEKFGN